MSHPPASGRPSAPPLRDLGKNRADRSRKRADEVIEQKRALSAPESVAAVPHAEPTRSMRDAVLALQRETRYLKSGRYRCGLPWIAGGCPVQSTTSTDA